MMQNSSVLAAMFASLLIACAKHTDPSAPMPGAPNQHTDAGSHPITQPTDSSPRRDCRRHSDCEFPLACADGSCAPAPTCNDVVVELPVLCLRWQDLADPQSERLRSTSVRLMVDGGVEALGEPNQFRCPEVGELVAYVGGEGIGYQPICGPDPLLAPQDDDAGSMTGVCCYGGYHVAGV